MQAKLQQRSVFSSGMLYTAWGLTGAMLSQNCSVVPHLGGADSIPCLEKSKTEEQYLGLQLGLGTQAEH